MLKPRILRVLRLTNIGRRAPGARLGSAVVSVSVRWLPLRAGKGCCWLVPAWCCQSQSTDWLSFACAATMMVLVAVLPAWSDATQSIECRPGLVVPSCIEVVLPWPRKLDSGACSRGVFSL